MDKRIQEAEQRRLALEKAQEELDEWKLHPTTQLFRNALQRWMLSIQNQWASGTFNRETLEATALANHKATSEYGMIEQILNLDAEQIEGILQNERED